MEFIKCIKRPHGLHLAYPCLEEDQSDASEAFIATCLIARSSVLQHLTEHVAEGASFHLHVSAACIRTWLLTLPILNSEKVFSMKMLGRGILVCAQPNVAALHCTCTSCQVTWMVLNKTADDCPAHTLL